MMGRLSCIAWQPFWTLSLMLLLAGMLPLSAQVSQAPILDTLLSPEARLEMMEKTYASKLAPIHGPVMQEYLRELDLLKSKMTASNRTAEAQAVDAEIARVRQAMTTTGIFPHAVSNDASVAATAKATDPGAGTPEAPKPAPDAGAPRTALTFQAAKANGGNIVRGSAAPLGSLDWTVEKLVAGAYDVAIVYACPSLDGAEQISLSFAGATHPFAIPADRATGSEKTFRIIRLGTITVDKDVAAGNIRLQSASATPKVWIRSVILSRPKAAASAGN